MFSPSDRYFGELPSKQMNQIVRYAKRVGWEKAIRQSHMDPWIKNYTLENSRATWLDLLPLEPGDVFVDAGCGWGSITCAAARKLWQVLAIDDTFQRVQFTRIRAEQQHLPRVTAVKASVFRMPLEDNVVDGIAFNGVLEWLGLSDTTKDPYEVQKAALREARRVLKPDGCLYIGIENRYSLRYLLADRDDHSFLRFTSLLPRRLANQWCLLRKGEPYLTYTHSLVGYKRMLEECGFGVPKIFFPFPNYRFPESIVPLEYRDVSQLLMEKLVRASSVKQFLYLGLYFGCSIAGLYGLLAHSYSIIAPKTNY